MTGEKINTITISIDYRFRKYLIYFMPFVLNTYFYQKKDLCALKMSSNNKFSNLFVFTEDGNVKIMQIFIIYANVY